MYNSVPSSIIHNSQTRKQPKYPSTNDWMNKAWPTHTLEYYSALEKKF